MNKYVWGIRPFTGEEMKLVRGFFKMVTRAYIEGRMSKKQKPDTLTPDPDTKADQGGGVVPDPRP